MPGNYLDMSEGVVPKKAATPSNDLSKSTGVLLTREAALIEHVRRNYKDISQLNDATVEGLLGTIDRLATTIHFLIEKQDRWKAEAEDRGLHKAYLRLRSIIPGAFDTPHAPSPEQVWETTENAARSLIEERDRMVGEYRARSELCDAQRRRAEKAEADKAALTEERDRLLRDFEAVVEKNHQNHQWAEREHYANVALTARVSKLEATLEFYANPFNTGLTVPDFYNELNFGKWASDVLIKKS